MRTQHLVVTLTLLLNAFLGLAQEVVSVQGVTGRALLTGSISESDARREALSVAKVEALRRAGVSQQLHAHEMLLRSEVNKDFSEFFSSDILSELQGAVQRYTVIGWNRKIDPETQLFALEVTIDAEVIKYSSRPDPTFLVKVEGVRGVYEEGEQLTFAVSSTQSCWLHIFNISDSQTSLIYPNKWERQKEIPANTRVTFPFETIEYNLFKNTPTPELNRLVFVFTKLPIPFQAHSGGEDQITNTEAIFSWVFGLMPDQRRVDYQVFTIR